MEHVGDFLCVLSERPGALGVNVEEDEAEGVSQSTTALDRGLADAREDDSDKLVNLLLGMNALWVAFSLEWDTSLQTKRINPLPPTDAQLG